MNVYDLLHGQPTRGVQVLAEMTPSKSLYELPLATRRIVTPSDAYREPVDLDPVSAGARPMPVRSTAEALAWFRIEREGLIGAVRTAIAADLDDLAWQLAWTLETFLDREGRWSDWTTTQTLARDAARRRGEVARQLRSVRDLGHIAWRQGLFDKSRELLEESLALARQAGAVTDEGHAHRGLAMIWGDLDRHDKAVQHAAQALRCAQQVGHLSMEADALNNLGYELVVLGDHRAALAHCTRARDVHASLGDVHAEAAAVDSMGLAYLGLGDAANAVAQFRRALELFGSAADQAQQALTLVNLAEAHEAGGDLPAAGEAWKRALDILDRLDHPMAARARSELSRLERV